MGAKLVHSEEEKIVLNEKNKYTQLKEILRNMKSIIIAFSGGVDSTFLLDIAREVLGTNVLAVIFASDLLPEKELAFARNFTRKRQIRLHEINTKVDSKDYFRMNPPGRCYHCKKDLFQSLLELARNQEFNWVADGSNLDDLEDYRPGNMALKELGIRSPLVEAALSKEEIRILSRERKLISWNKPSAACLASRIPYGDPITSHKLKEIAGAEAVLHNLGIDTVRVRHHGSLARIEIPPEVFPTLLAERKTVVKKFKSLGFSYISLDLEGFRSGSMNEVLDTEHKEKNNGLQ